MRRASFALLTALMAVMMAVSAAVAANPHFVVGPNFTVNQNGTVTATGSIAGLGNQDIDVRLTAQVSVQVLCRNPGGNIAPGQTQVTTVTGQQTAIQVENGRANFNVTTDAPALDPEATPRELGCPNNKWTPEIGNVTVLSATLEVFQPSGSNTRVLSATYP